MHKFTTEELVSQKPSPEDFRKRPRYPLVFILHNIRSLQNVGLFFRLADAFLVEKIYLTGYTGFPRLENDLRDERVITHAEKEINKTAIKLVPFVPWEQHEDVHEIISHLKSQGFQIIAVEQTDESINYKKASYRFPIALIFGHERTGVEDDLLANCNLAIEIPMLGLGNSHNVATSAAIITSHLETLLKIS
jgi:tRNA G18 (ribose-2'-O)-methylase SpoU